MGPHTSPDELIGPYSIDQILLTIHARTMLTCLLLPWHSFFCLVG